MSLRLSPASLAAAYEFLRTTTPFRGWRLPPSDEVEFHVIRDPHCFGDCVIDGTTPVIRISERKNGHVHTLFATVAHEMIHLRQFLIGDSANHNDLFHKLARRVCRSHGYDPQAF